MTLETAFNAFKIEQQIRGNSTETLKYYCYCVNPLIKQLGGDSPVEGLNLKQLKLYTVKLQSSGITSNSVKSYVKGLKAFLSWLYSEQYINENLGHELKLPKAKRKVIDVLTDGEIKRLFSCFDTKTFLGIRNYCMCALMVDSGLRKSELIRLKTTDLHIAEGYILVNGKGNKQRIVPIGLNTQKYLIRYLAYRTSLSRVEQLFITQQNTPITACVIERLFKKLKKDCLTPRLHPHLLRHTFATRYLENGGNMYTLQQILGHSSLEMVKKYVHLTSQKNVVYFSSFSPLDNIG